MRASRAALHPAVLRLAQTSSIILSPCAAFKNGDVRFLICTDVAARGIDVKELPYVINVTLPDRSVGSRQLSLA